MSEYSLEKSHKMPKVLITGAAGFIGMHASLRFLTEGWNVIGLDNFNDYYSVKLKRDRMEHVKAEAKILKTTFEIRNCDLNSGVWSSLEKQHFDAVVHLAAQAGVRYSLENPRAYLDSNVLGFQSVLEFVKKKNIQRFVYASSSSVYGQDSMQPFNENEPCNSPESYYAATKKMNELMAKSYNHTFGLRSVGLRFFTVYGPWGRPDMAPMIFASAAFNNSPVKIYNYGNQRRDFTYIDDIVEGILSIILMPQFPSEAEICNIGNGTPVGLMEFVERIEVATSKVLRKEFIEAQKGDVSETYASTSKLFQMTGYESKTTLDTGIEKFINWFKEYYNLNS